MLLPWSILSSKGSSRQTASRRPGKKDKKLPRREAVRLEVLEDRTLPSVSFPLNPTSWTELGPRPIVNGLASLPAPVSGRVSGIAAHPTDPNTIYMASAGGGIWKTTNGGQSWTALTDDPAGVPVGLRTLFMGSIAISASNPNVIYAGTGEATNSGASFYGRGILKSTDGGATWTLFRGSGGANTEFDRRTVGTIVVDPTSPNGSIVYAAVSGNGENGLTGNAGIWKSTNGGTTWTNTTAAQIAGSVNRDFSDLVMDPTNPNVLYAAIGSAGGSAQNGLYKTTNGGATWTKVNNFPETTTNPNNIGVIRIAISKTNPNILYAGVDDLARGFAQIYKSTNGGINWTRSRTQSNYLGGQGSYDSTIHVDPNNPNLVYVAGQLEVLQSQDGGANWFDISVGADGNGPHVDHHAQGPLAFDAAGRLIDGNDGGVWRLDSPSYGAIKWTNLNSNLGTIQIVGVALHPTDPNIALAGAQDNGAFKFNDSLGWDGVRQGADGGYVAFDPFNGNTLYQTTQFLGLERSDDGGQTWISRTAGIGGNPNFYAPFIVDPSTPGRLLAGTDQVYESLDRGDSWVPISQILVPIFPGIGQPIDALGLARTDTNVIYAAVAGHVFVTTNKGATNWIQRDPIGGAGSGLEYTDIAVDPSNPAIAYVTVGEFRGGIVTSQVFRTQNFGVNWTPVGGAGSGLPDLPAYAVVVDSQLPGNTADDIVYVGNDDGVYRSIGGGTWTRFGAGLPRAQVHDLDINKRLGILAAGTHGRGLWEISILDDPYVVSSDQGGFVTGPQSSITFRFSEDMDTAAFSLADVASFTFTNPDGSGFQDLKADGALTGFTWLDAKTLRIDFVAQTAVGIYTMKLGGNFLRSADDLSQLDQNRDGTPGDYPTDLYAHVFKIRTPKTYSVDATNTNAAPDGSAANPFKTIQDAVAAAAANFGPDKVIVYGNNTNNVYVVTGSNLVLGDTDITFKAETLLQGTAGTPAPVIVKLSNNIIDVVTGQFRVEGKANAKVYFTSFQDDSVGGDTNGDGNINLPNRNDWGGVRFRGGAVDQGPDETTGSFINYADIRYTGKTLYDSVAGAPTEFASVRMEFDGANAAQVRVWNTTFQHGGKALDVEMRSLEGRGPDVANPMNLHGLGHQGLTFVDNSINGLFVNVPFLPAPLVPEFNVDSRWDDVGVPYVLTKRLIVTKSLTIDPGMVVKVQNDAIDASGRTAHLYVDGTVDQPVYFTALTDDYINPTYAGNGSADTNNDGTASQPAPGGWGGLRVGDGHIDHAVVRYAGGVVPVNGTFYNHSAVAILSQDYTFDAGPYQSFRLSNTEIRDTFRGQVFGTTYDSAAVSAGVDPLTAVQQVQLFNPLRVGEIQVIDNWIHDNLGRAIETAPNVYHARPNSLGGYGIHFRRNVIERNEVNGIYTVWGQSTFGAGPFTDLDSANLGMENKAYLDDTDIVQTIPALPSNQGFPNDNVLQVNHSNYVLQAMSRREVTPANGFLDKFQGAGAGLGTAFQTFVSALQSQGADLGPLPGDGDNGLFYFKVDFDKTARGVAVTGVNQAAAGNLRGEEWRDWGVDLVSTSSSGLFPLKARSAAGSDGLTPVSGGNVLSTSDPSNNSFDLVFPNMVTAVGFWVVDNEVTSANERIEFYGETNNLLETIALPTTGSGPVFVGRISKQPIYKVRVLEDANDQINSVFSDNVATAIPDNGFITRTINVGSSFTIDDLNVLLNVQHARVGDLKVELTHGATTVTLVNQRGGAGANFVNTTLDDEANLPISLGAAPFPGSYKPESPLSAFDGQDASGAWTLKITDLTGNGFGGTLQNWQLTFHSPNLISDAMGIDDLYYVDAGQSLVIKTDGANNGLEVGGSVDAGVPKRLGYDAQDVTPGGLAVGGTLRIMGQARNPVVLTSWRDDSVGAGPVGHIQTDTNADGSKSTPNAGDWNGIRVLPGANSARIENVQQIAGTIVRTPSDLNPYTIGDEPGSDTDLLERGIGNFANVQDGTLIEHADIRFARIGIDVSGYPEGKMSIESNETDTDGILGVDTNGTQAGAEKLQPFVQNEYGRADPFSGNFSIPTFNTYSGAVRVSGFVNDPHDYNSGFSNDVDFYQLPQLTGMPRIPYTGITPFGVLPADTPIYIDVTGTSNDSTAGPICIYGFNHEGKLVYLNGANFTGDDGTPGTGNFAGGWNMQAGDIAWTTQDPQVDVAYIAITGPGRLPRAIVPQAAGGLLPDNNFVSLTPVSPGNETGEGFFMRIVDSTGNLQDIPASFEFIFPGGYRGGYEAEFRTFGQNRLLDAVRDTEGEWIIRQNIIRDFGVAGINLHDSFNDVPDTAGANPASVVQQSARYVYPVATIDPNTGQPTWNPKFLIPGVSVYNNIIRDGTGDGIAVSESPRNPLTDTGVPVAFHQIINNTIHGVSGTGINLRTRGGPTVLNNILSKNNIGLNNQELGDIDPALRGPIQTVVGYNIFFQNGTDIVLNNFNGFNNQIAVDPQYVDEAARDLRILYTSPAVDAALSDITDKLGSARHPDEPLRAPNDDERNRTRIDNPSKLNVGAGQFPFYDIGAMEANEPSLRVTQLSLFAANGVTGGPTSSFTVEFSGRVDPSTVNSATVRLTKSGVSIPVNVTNNVYDPVHDLHTFFFSLNAGQQLLDGDYTLVLDGVSAGDPAIRDIAGQLLDGEFNGVSFPSGNGVPGGDFVYNFTIQTSQIGDLVFNDVNGNGARDVGESGIGGVTVRLVGAGADGLIGTGDDQSFPAQQTNAQGAYLFTLLPPQLYKVTVDEGSPSLSGMVLTTGNEPLFKLLGVGEKFLNADFGYRVDAGNATIGDLIWDDLDGDGVRDAGEPGLPGVQLSLVGAGRDLQFGTADDVLRSATTDPNGIYQFTGLFGGQYRVTVNAATLPPFNYQLTTGNQNPYLAVTLNPSQNFTAADFGYQQKNASIGDKVFNDTNGDGIDNDGASNGLAGVRVYADLNDNGVLDANEPFADSASGSGAYTITGLGAGTYKVRVVGSTVPAGFALTTNNLPLTVTLSAGQAFTAADFGYAVDTNNASIGDRVFNDLNGDGTDNDGPGNGLAGVQVYLDLNNNGTREGSEPLATTDANGNYTIGSLPAGDYVVRVVSGPAGFVLTTNNLPLNVHVNIGQAFVNADFGYQQRQASIGDLVYNDLNGNGLFDGSDVGINGVFVNLTWAGPDNVLGTGDDVNYPAATTAGGGLYNFTGLPKGLFRVQVDANSPALAGFGPTTPNPVLVNVPTPTTVVTTADFGWQQQNGSIGDKVFIDVNADGVQQGNEGFGVANARVFIDANSNGVFDAGEKFAFTNNNGDYVISALGAGTYRVMLDATTLPAGSGVTSANPRIVTLGPGENNVTTDFGVALPPNNPAGVYYLTLAANAVLHNSDGAPVAATINDIMRLVIGTDGSFTYTKYFEGADVGLSTTNERIDAFTILADGTILISTAGAFSLQTTYSSPGSGSGASITGFGEDLLRFAPLSTGANTAGVWSLYFDGSDVGLSGSAENVDAVSVLADGRLVLSTAGTPSVTGVSGAANSDLLRFTPTQLGATTKGTWAMFFDASDVGLSGSTENLDAVALGDSGNPNLPLIYLSTNGNFSVPGQTGKSNDILRFNPTQLGTTTAGTYTAVTLRGDSFGLLGQNLTGIFLGLAPGDAPLMASGRHAEAQSPVAARWLPTASGALNVYVDNANGLIDAGELARIHDAVAALSSVWSAHGGLRLVEVTDPAQADVRIREDVATPIGGVKQGVLGFAQFTYDVGIAGFLADGRPVHQLLGHDLGGQALVTLVSGWNWYTGADAKGIGRGQYDYQSALAHELGHMIGLDHLAGNGAVMAGTIGKGQARRSYTARDTAFVDYLYANGSNPNGKYKATLARGVKDVAASGVDASLLAALEARGDVTPAQLSRAVQVLAESRNASPTQVLNRLDGVLDHLFSTPAGKQAKAAAAKAVDGLENLLTDLFNTLPV